MESQLVRSLQKTSLDESRQSIIKYKGKSEDDYKQVLEQLRAGAEAALGDFLTRSQVKEDDLGAQSSRRKKDDAPDKGGAKKRKVDK